VGSLARSGVTANQVTVLACLVSILTGILLWCWPTARWALLLVPVVLFSRMALNAVDGMLAREHGQKSRLGAVLNELTDVISDAALYLPFAVVPGLDPRLVVLAAVVAIIGEMTGTVAVQVGAERRYDGPMGKSDRAFVFGLIALLLGIGMQPGPWLTAFQYLIVILGIVTIVNRSRRALATGVR
ncbi:MAG TPA: CDP-alcohol phosphatidyltransferase family protein, partial [Gemmatimonadales bacterium]|nr:CDP-alcohol phosphatidyltransferase family protein [Gemmatimonadales bacterium]